jgi:hypothetical protein
VAALDSTLTSCSAKSMESDKFSFSQEERKRIVDKAQTELRARAAEEIADDAEELVGMKGLEFSDDEGPDEDEDEGSECEIDEGEKFAFNVPVTASTVSLYPPTAQMASRTESRTAPRAGVLSMNLFDAVTQEVNALPEAAEPEYIEVEMTLDTGATVHAADREDLPCHVIEESPGSKAGQQFQAAGGKLIANEGQATVEMLAPGADGELICAIQIAKVTRPLLSVTKMTESGKINVLCKKDEALVLDENGKVLARFARKGGLYTAIMRVKNPRFQPFLRPGR